MRKIAEATGVSRMTVSRAFRPEAPVKPEVRARVLAAAKALGYAPDRMVTELMTSFVKRRPVKYRETFAALWWPERWTSQHANAGFEAELRRGMEACAARHGCGIEHLVVSPEISGRALTRILQARGIIGVVLTPPALAETPAPELDWEAFCGVIIGTTLRKPRLHRAQVSHYTSMVQMLETVRDRGYRRPCLLVRPELDERMQRAYSAAFMAWGTGDAARILREPPAQAAGVAAWLNAVDPDVVIADTDGWREAFAGVRSRDFVSLAVEDPNGEISGNHQNYARVAEAAVDLLVQARLRHETGVPPEPLTMLTTGFWVEGRTLRRRAVD